MLTGEHETLRHAREAPPWGRREQRHSLHLVLSGVSGQVQSRQCIEDVIHFAWEEKLFLLADEVRAASAPRSGGQLFPLGAPPGLTALPR